MERIGEQTLLYDFYGELLTEHQRLVYDSVVNHDLSISEIAEQEGISRQGVFDLVRRCDRILDGYEEKLHLVERFLRAQDEVEKMQSLLEEIPEESIPQVKEIKKIAGQLLDEF